MSVVFVSWFEYTPSLLRSSARKKKKRATEGWWEGPVQIGADGGRQTSVHHIHEVRRHGASGFADGDGDGPKEWTYIILLA